MRNYKISAEENLERYQVYFLSIFINTNQKIKMEIISKISLF